MGVPYDTALNVPRPRLIAADPGDGGGGGTTHTLLDYHGTRDTKEDGFAGTSGGFTVPSGDTWIGINSRVCPLNGNGTGSYDFYFINSSGGTMDNHEFKWPCRVPSNGEEYHINNVKVSDLGLKPGRTYRLRWLDMPACDRTTDWQDGQDGGGGPHIMPADSGNGADSDPNCRYLSYSFDVWSYE